MHCTAVIEMWCLRYLPSLIPRLSLLRPGNEDKVARLTMIVVHAKSAASETARQYTLVQSTAVYTSTKHMQQLQNW